MAKLHDLIGQVRKQWGDRQHRPTIYVWHEGLRAEEQKKSPPDRLVQGAQRFFRLLDTLQSLDLRDVLEAQRSPLQFERKGTPSGLTNWDIFCRTDWHAQVGLGPTATEITL